MVYNIIKKDNSNLLKIAKFAENDVIGSPYIYEYSEGKISSGTMYFIMILSDLLKYFGDIKNKKIIEIGGGYGGQAKIISDYGCCSYSIIDIYPTIELARKYLTTFKSNIRFIKTPDEIEKIENYDIVISNWCLSELSDDAINFYIDTIIKNCSNAYFYMNLWDIGRKNIIKQKIERCGFSVQEIEEVPKTSTNKNYLWVCKK